MKILNVIDAMNPIFGGSVERSFQINNHLGAAGIKVEWYLVGMGVALSRAMIIDSNKKTMSSR
jgi:hypothetical protein